MIGVTERAKEELKKILTDHVDNPQAALRLNANEQGQLGLSIDVEMPGDQAVEYEGSKLLLVETELANNLDGISIDVEDTEEGSRLVVVNKSE